VDGAVVAALVTSGVAVVVAGLSSLREERRRGANRRDDRRRTALTETQDAALALRNALRDYGAALRSRTATRPSGPGTAYVMSVPEPVDAAVSAAEGRVMVARSRLAEEPVEAALDHWRAVARISLIDPSDAEASAEQDAFAALNELIGTALRPSAKR
jgi:hypothetical protein